MKIRFENIFRSAEFKLTMVYFLILVGITAIFNVVIFTAITSDRMAISEPKWQGVTSQIQEDIIEARNIRAEKQIFEAMLVLDIAILVAGGWGSLVLARKSLAPLERAYKLQSEFVSNASHEIRTPLAAIQLETELILKDKTASKDDLREILESNLEEARSLTALTDMLLRLSRIEKLEFEKVNLNEIVRARMAKFPNVNIELTENKDFIIHANSVAVDELATIFIDNAAKYNSEPNSPIEIKILRKNRQAVLEIANFSPQIEKEELNKMFERFYRADNVRSCNSRCEGHGLGLAIAQKLAEMLDANLSVRNEKFNIEGEAKYKTTFSVGFDFDK